MSASDSNSAPPPPKRRRCDNNKNERTRSDFWFEDGNVILQADKTLFRVHQSILSRHSQILKDTCTIPQGSQTNESIDDCPVVMLSDTSGDVHNLISLLYENDKTLHFGTRLSAIMLGSMLRLGKKYQITYLENEARSRLHHDYPTSLEDWEGLYDGNRQIVDEEDDVISIAHEFGISTILPAAYTKYLQKRPLELLQRDFSLPTEARRQCILGSFKIQEFVKQKNVEALCPPLVLPSKSCRGNNCRDTGWKAIKKLPIWVTGAGVPYGIFQWFDYGDDDLCPYCQKEVRKLAKKVRSQWWSILPTFYELPAWSDLEDTI